MSFPEPLAFDTAAGFGLAGRSVLVTGGAHGLGVAIASAFVGAGARVAIVDRDAEALATAQRALGERGDVRPFVADVRDGNAVEAAVQGAAEAFGGLDVLVNDAAIYPTGAIEELPHETLLDVLATNVGGYASSARAALPALRASSAARIINISSITFFLGVPAGLGAYIASKGAVIGLTRALARELGPEGVTVNSIAPGAFPTRAESIIEDRAAYDRLILESQCIKRRGDVGDIAAAALFLGGDASSFITGQTIVVDGGWVFS
jgi:3-oxoacyl-[acyl-carrier protein] reductase